MRLDLRIRGEAALAERMSALAEMPGLSQAVADAAEAAAGEARLRLAEGGEPGIAEAVELEHGGPHRASVRVDHPRAWFAEYGTRRRRALGWMAAAARAGQSALSGGAVEAVRRALARFARRNGR